MKFAALDLETAPEGDNPQVFALQPWRVLEGRARITSLATVLPGSKPALARHPAEIRDHLQVLIDENIPVVTWNGIFDVAWLLASGYEALIRKLTLFDAMLLWKWVDNSQRAESIPAWSLVDGVNRWLTDIPWRDQYVALKKNEPPPGENDPYWELRAQFDALATQMIADRAWQQLTPKQRRGASYEAKTILPVARAWVSGIHLDPALAESMVPVMTQEMQDIEMRLGVYTTRQGYWTPSTILRSPKQLRETLYSKWGLPCTRFTPKEEPSTDKAALTYLADHDDKVLEILRWRELNTQFSKFVRGISKVSNYLGSSIAHPAPKLFSTYTGRMTYSSKSGKKGDAAKAYIGPPIHQWPRPKAMRKLIKAPPGKALVEFDASGQEMRLMACQSQDPAMIEIFNAPPPFDDIHSFMGSRLAGIGFDAFLKGKAEGVEAIVGSTGYRYLGKFYDLSCQYRIGYKSLRLKSRVDYGMKQTFMQIKQGRDTYLRTFKGIKKYWDRAIKIARERGYAETMAGRRFALELWHDGFEWGTQQSAINFPIQGSGGDQKELALSVLTEKYPELEFVMDLHDGLYFYVDINKQLPALLSEARFTLNTIDYGQYWDYRPPIPLVWDCSLGTNWGNKRDLK